MSRWTEKDRKEAKEFSKSLAASYRVELPREHDKPFAEAWIERKVMAAIAEHKKKHPFLKANRIIDHITEQPAKTQAWCAYQPIEYFAAMFRSPQEFRKVSRKLKAQKEAKLNSVSDTHS